MFLVPALYATLTKFKCAALGTARSDGFQICGIVACAAPRGGAQVGQLRNGLKVSSARSVVMLLRFESERLN
eukprot:6177574-Pleurochrysis_carterae.AAC.2